MMTSDSPLKANPMTHTSINALIHSPRRLLALAILPVAATSLALFGGGCKVANTALRADFVDFNSIIQGNQTQQMLLNLVRMHYRETPLFMQAGALTASYESSIGGNSTATIPVDGDSEFGLEIDYKFSSKPTISYTPIEGKAYVDQFMSEVTPTTFALLVRAGWPIVKLSELLVERVTLQSGEVMMGRPSSDSYPKFQAFFQTLQDAEDVDELSVAPMKGGGFELVASKQTIAIESFQFRSLFSAMFMAARNVDTPPSRVSRTKVKRGAGELIIRVYDTPPKDALVFVEYTGHYYAIANDDIRSKDTLALLMQLSRIQAGPASPPPLITIPAR